MMKKNKRRIISLIVALSVAGLALRLILLIQAGWRYDYDEGMVGLQALRIQRGQHPIFHPGQPYLAALESYLIALCFNWFGTNAVTLKIVPWLLSGVYVGTTGWLGWRVFNRRVGVLSALLAAFAPAYLLIVGIKTWGATAETLLLGNLALICASYVVDTKQSQTAQNRSLILLGFIGGVAFWVSWLIVFYAIPILITLLLFGRKVLIRHWWATAFVFFAGSAPFWLYNAQHGWATFHYLFSDQGDTWGNLLPILDHLNYDLTPRMVSGDPKWHILSWPAVWWLQIIYEGGLIALVVTALLHQNHANRPARVLLALFVVGLPIIYVISGYGNHALNSFGFDATGRYVLMIHSALPIGAAVLCDGIARWRPWLRIPAAAILSSVIALNLLGAARINPTQAFTSPYYTRQPATLKPLIRCLDEQRINAVWTDVGVAHVLMFETQERILAADWYDIYGAKGLVRFPEVPLKIKQAERVAFVEVILPGQTNTRFEQAFQEAGISYMAARPSPDLLVIIPLGPVNPIQVDEGLGYQF